MDNRFKPAIAIAYSSDIIEDGTKKVYKQLDDEHQKKITA